MYSKDGYRKDIDGLRAVAVVAVIVNHFYAALLPSGFLGVDVFFVISGYVITQSLVSGCHSSWSGYLLGFYSKRIRRLLPALVACVAVSVIASFFIFGSVRREILGTGAASLLGLSNVYLYYVASDYFSLDAVLNPFTHTWSLGVEEQFYLVYPVLLVFCGLVFSSRDQGDLRVIAILGGLSLASFVLYIWSYSYSPVASFYLMPMRFWELSLGGIIFLFRWRLVFLRDKKWAASIALLGLCAVFVLPQQHRVYSTILAVLLAGMLIASASPGVTGRVLSSRLFVYIGALSYSLYLWHWNTLVLGRYALGDSYQALTILLFLAFCISVFSYHCIERPLRYASYWQGTFRPFAASFLLVLPLACFVFWRAPSLDFSNYSLPSFLGIHQAPSWAGKVPCHGKNFIDTRSVFFETCLLPERTPEKPHTVFLLGDSHAAQLTFMLDSVLQGLPFSARFANTESDLDFPKGSILGVNENPNLEYVLGHAREGDILMLAMHRGRLNEERDAHLDPLLPVHSNHLSRSFESVLSNYVKRFSELGVKVVLIRDTPLMRKISSSEACNLQLQLWGASICSVSMSQDMHTRTRIDRIYDRLLYYPNVYSWDPLVEMYSGGKYMDVVDEYGEYVMMDAHHITQYQSESLAGSFSQFLVEVLKGE